MKTALSSSFRVCAIPFCDFLTHFLGFFSRREKLVEMALLGLGGDPDVSIMYRQH